MIYSNYYKIAYCIIFMNFCSCKNMIRVMTNISYKLLTQFSGSGQAVVRQFQGSFKAVIREHLGCFQTVFRPILGKYSLQKYLFSCSFEALFRMYSGNVQQVVRFSLIFGIKFRSLLIEQIVLVCS